MWKLTEEEIGFFHDLESEYRRYTCKHIQIWDIVYNRLGLSKDQNLTITKEGEKYFVTELSEENKL